MINLSQATGKYLQKSSLVPYPPGLNINEYMDFHGLPCLDVPLGVCLCKLWPLWGHMLILIW